MSQISTMISIKIKTLAAELIAGFLLLLFAYTAAYKIIDNELFVFQMRLAPFPYMVQLAPFLGWLIPGVELMSAFGLLFDRYRLKSLYGSVILLAIFEFYIATMMLSGSHLPCTCGGIISTMSWKAHLFFNAVCICLGIFAIKQYKKNHNHNSLII
ncbi:MAG: MauE/DoxX family redox-associated membrane protein [Bacteroidota bacterium]